MDPNTSNVNASGNNSTTNNSNNNAGINSGANNVNNKKQFSRNHYNKRSNQSAERRSAADSQQNKPWPRSQRREYIAGFSSSNASSSSNAHHCRTPQQTLTTAKAGTHANAGGKRRQGRGLNSIASGPTDIAVAGAGLVPSVDSTNVTNVTPSIERYELNSIYAQGSKKQNLNHLLNFHYAPREIDNDGDLGVFGRNTGHRTVRAVSKKHKYNKEQFLQANYQFVVKPSAKLKITASPDALIDWELIEQINVQTTEEPQCPICLYPPIAAKLTRCGHVYCWPCILHFLALSEKTWCRCPICHEAIHVPDLKSAAIVQQVPMQVGHHVTLQLMRRLKGTLYIEPQSANAVTHSAPRFPQLSSSAAHAKLFSKFLIAKRVDILQIIEHEHSELLAADDDPSSPEFVFIQQALDLLKERREKLGTLTQPVDTTGAENRNTEPDKAKFLEAAQIAASVVEPTSSMNNDDAKNEVKKCYKPEEVTSESDTVVTPNDSTPPTPPSAQGASDYFYFYQSLDGQNVFLHPLNMKMIEANYGNVNHAPKQIVAQLVQKEFYSMDDKCRRRFACLSHLPLTCQFAVVEVAMKPPLVSDEIVRLFESDLSVRKRERRRRARDEDRREQLINEINDRQMGKLIASTISLNLNSSHEFPAWGFEEAPIDVNLFGFGTNAEPSIPTLPSRYATSYSSVALEGGDTPHFMYKPDDCKQARSLPLTSWGAAPAHDTHSLMDSHSPLCTNLSDVLAEAMSQNNKQQAKETKTNDKKAAAVGGANGGSAVGGPATGAIKKTKKPKKLQPLFSTGINYQGN